MVLRNGLFTSQFRLVMENMTKKFLPYKLIRVRDINGSKDFRVIESD